LSATQKKKGKKMPQGKGTYGSKVGRPPKKSATRKSSSNKGKMGKKKG
jgi:hypothetical protein